MINAGDLINQKSKKKFDLFSIKKKSRINTIRFATHFREIKKASSFFIMAKKLGYNVFVNLMQASEKEEEEIKKAINIISKTNSVSVLYFADSLGKMDPPKVKKLFEIAKKYWKNDLGIHTHDNKGLALQNCIEAIKSGVKWIDSTILGMGRGAGNIQTEILIAEFLNNKINKYNLKPVYELSEDIFSKLRKKYKWGKSLNYHLAANYNIHPTYIQTLESDNRYSNKKIFDTINYLKKTDSKSYNQLKLKEILDTNQNDFLGTWNAKNWCKNKNILLLGQGDSIKKYKTDIEELIKYKKLKVISLNINEIINKKFITCYVASNENRIMVDINKYSNIKKPIILPYKRVKKFFKQFKSKYIHDYGLKTENNKIKILNKYCVMPNSLVFCYALGVCMVGKCSKIYMAGFDGYALGDSRQDEMVNLIKLIKKKYKNLELISLTPTAYPFNKSSLYAKNL